MPIDFDGVDDRVDYGDVADMAGDFTLSCWFKSSGTGVDQPLITKLRPSTAWNYQMNISTADVLQGYAGAFVTGTTNIADGAWHHGAFVRTGTTGKLYVDGVQEGGDVVGQTQGVNNYNLYVGAWPHSDGTFTGGNEAFFDGIISEVAIWSSALSTGDILQLSKSRIKGMPLQIDASNLVIYSPIDDQPHGTSADGDTIRDMSGNGNNGTGNDGANNTGLAWQAESVLSYPSNVIIAGITATVVIILKRPGKGLLMRVY